MSALARWLAVHRVEAEWLGSPKGRSMALAGHVVGGAVEVLASFLIGVVGYGIASAGTLAPWSTPVAFGLAVAIMVAAAMGVATVDGNTAFTLSAFFLGYYSIIKTAVAVVGQCLGYLLAALMVRWVVGTSTLADTATTRPSSTVNTGQAIAVEATLTFMAGLVALLLARMPTPHGSGASRAFIVGVGVAVCLATSVQLGAGGSLNFARSLAPAVVTGNYSHLWVYAVANVVAAAGVAVLMWCAEWLLPYANTYDELRRAAYKDADDAYAECRVPQNLEAEAPILAQEMTMVHRVNY